MRFHRVVATFLFAAGIGFAAFCQNASAQQAASALDIVGLKLGMTVDQAKAALQNYDPAVKVTPIYGFLEQNGYVTERARIQEDPVLPPDPLTVPVGLLGISLPHVYAGDHHEVTAGSKEPVKNVSGEWFLLRFTPNDNGGSLYAIARSVRYPAEDVDHSLLPDAAAFRDKVLSTYGKPTSVNGPDYDWMYDVRGRALSGSSRDYARCRVAPVEPGGDATQMPFVLRRGQQEFEAEFTRGDLTTALSDVDRRTLDGDTSRRVALLFDQLESFAPNLANAVAGADLSRFRQCGVNLQVNLEADDGVHLDDFTMFLADLDRTYFDNGLKAYFASKAPAASPASVPKL